jgi:hypothetical protein
VPISGTEVRSKFKSPLRVVAWFLCRSRKTQAEKCRSLAARLKYAEPTIARQEAEIQRPKEEIRALQQQTQFLQQQNRQQARMECRLPEDPPRRGHRYGIRLIRRWCSRYSAGIGQGFIQFASARCQSDPHEFGLGITVSQALAELTLASAPCNCPAAISGGTGAGAGSNEQAGESPSARPAATVMMGPMGPLGPGIGAMMYSRGTMNRVGQGMEE